MIQFLKSYFKFSERKTDLRTEVVAGTATFLAMAYIIFVNPNILAAAGMDKAALISVTCIATALATLATGIFANAPIAMAPGMGFNAFFAYSLVLTDHISWQTALGIVFLSGLFFLLLTALGIRKKILEAIPHSLISAMAVGIGLFITFIGLVNMGLVVKNDFTLVSAGPMTPTVMIGLAGFTVMILLETRRIKGSMIFGIITSTALAILLGKIQMPSSFFSFEINLEPVAFKLDIPGALKASLLAPIFTLMFMHLFDSIGSLVACCHQAKLLDEKGKMRDLDKLLTIDAGSAMMGAVLGTSTITAYVESAIGIEQGGRTGFTSVITALWFVLAIIFLPLIAMVPAYATAPALILVGFFMIREIKNIHFTDMEEGFPAFVIIVMIALSYSISTGLAFGFITYVLFKLIKLKLSEIKPAMWVFFFLSLLHFIVK